MKNLSLISAIVLALSSTAALADGHTGKPVLVSKAGYFTDGHNMTLYTFDKDSKGVSNCYDKCAQNWPPLALEKGDKLGKDFSAIKRKDGTKQIAYKGQPLYLWVKDTKPGQTTGDGVKGVWHLVKP